MKANTTTPETPKARTRVEFTEKDVINALRAYAAREGGIMIPDGTEWLFGLDDRRVGYRADGDSDRAALSLTVEHK